MNDSDKRQVSAWRILLPKMVPDLKAMQMEVEQKSITGVIVLPQKVPLDNPKVSTIEQSESETFLPGDVSQDRAESQVNRSELGPNDDVTEEKDSLSQQVLASDPKVDAK